METILALAAIFSIVTGYPTGYFIGKRAIAKKEQEASEQKQLSSGTATRSRMDFEQAKKMVVDNRLKSNHAHRATKRYALEYIERGEEIDWTQVIKRRISDPDFSLNSLTAVVEHVIGTSLDIFSAREQKVLLETFVSCWVKSIESKLELALTEKDVLDNAGKISMSTAPLSIEQLSSQTEWEKLYSDLDPAEKRTTEASVAADDKGGQ